MFLIDEIEVLENVSTLNGSRGADSAHTFFRWLFSPCKYGEGGIKFLLFLNHYEHSDK